MALGLPLRLLRLLPLAAPLAEAVALGLRLLEGEREAVGEALPLPEREAASVGPLLLGLAEREALAVPEGLKEVEALALTLRLPELLALGERLLRPDLLSLPLALRVRVGEPVTLRVGETDLLRVGEELGVTLEEEDWESVAERLAVAAGLALPLALMLAVREGLRVREGEALVLREAGPLLLPLGDCVPAMVMLATVPRLVGEVETDWEGERLCLGLEVMDLLLPGLRVTETLVGGDGEMRALAEGLRVSEAREEKERVTEGLREAEGLREEEVQPLEVRVTLRVILVVGVAEGHRETVGVADRQKDIVEEPVPVPLRPPAPRRRRCRSKIQSICTAWQMAGRGPGFQTARARWASESSQVREKHTISRSTWRIQGRIYQYARERG